MNAILLLTVLSLAMPIFGEEPQVKKQDKRGILGLSHGGFGGFVPQGNPLAIGAGYGQSYLGGALGHGVSAPAYSNNYNAPLYLPNRLGYSGNLGYGGLGYGGPGYVSGGLGHAPARLGYGTTGLGYGATGLGYGAAGLGYGATGLGYGAAGLGYGAGLAHGLNTGYRNGW